MNPIILIPARMASTRLPNKPLADINGKPMIQHVYEQAIKADIGRVVVAADDEQIVAAIEKKAAGEAVITGKHHASGSDRIWEALQIIDKDNQHDIIINVQGDLPTIEPSIIQKSLIPLKQNSNADIATLVCKIDNEADKNNPSVVKPIISWYKNDKYRIGKALYFTRCIAPYGDGEIYHHIGLYAYRRDALQKFVSLKPSHLEKREKLEQLRALENNMNIDVIEVETSPLGVDTEEQLEQARILKNG